MTIKQFQKKYKDKGGVNKLTELRALFFPQKYIAEYFEVSQERVRQWMVEFFGSVYDPRADRKEIVIANILEFRRNNTMKEFDKAFKRTRYYKEVKTIYSKEFAKTFRNEVLSELNNKKV